MEKEICKIATALEKEFPGLELTYLAIIDDEGRILYQPDPSKNDFVAVGTTTDMFLHGYIRHQNTGAISHEMSQRKQISSCGGEGFVSRYEMRLILGIRDANPYQTEFAARAAIIRAEGVPTRSNVSSLAVIEEENGTRKKQFDPSVTFISIDFDVPIEMYY